MKSGHLYVLGTGLSHDGSACLLKDGKICVAIEKERITRVKHDGGNDTEAIKYCLKAEGITIHDLDLVVQNANFGKFAFGNGFFEGQRLFTEEVNVPVVTISHHLAHAYSTIGTSPFSEFNILVIDGCGSPYDDCNDLQHAMIPDVDKIPPGLAHLYCEKDSYYQFGRDGNRPLYKDFSEYGYYLKGYPMHPETTMHSIGGVYNAASRYCFGNMDDPGKLMGLGPYGKAGVFKDSIFDLRDGRVFVNYGWMNAFRTPARNYEEFKRNFQYYADIAYWVQRETEKAIIYVINARLELSNTGKLCYAGGVALNAVANAKILTHTKAQDLYVQPAAGDNGLSIGCAYYGWLEVLKKERQIHNQSTCFGFNYPPESVRKVLNAYKKGNNPLMTNKVINSFFNSLSPGVSVRPSNRFAVIQFNIENNGVYQVVIENGGLTRSSAGIFNTPTSIVNITGPLFVQCAFHPEYFVSLHKAGKFEVSKSADWQLFRETADLAKAAASLNEGYGGSVFNLKYTQCADYIQKAAQLLASGKVIGWFQDESEFGPRALGRRSILADPRNPVMRSFINSEIKFREDFRPFAPSVLLEDASVFFNTRNESPYMILVDQVKEEWNDKIQSVVHVDATSRVQTVTPAWNPKYYQLLQEFKKITGIPVLLNTSFNKRGMPIVETPTEALDFFFTCKLDHLVIDDCIIEK